MGIANAQLCNEEQAIEANFVGRNNADEMFIGQSFQACTTGRLESVFAKVGGQNDSEALQFRVYSGKPSTPNGQENIIPVVAGPATNSESFTVNLSGTQNLVNGSDYTFTFHRAVLATAKFFRIKSDNVAAVPNYDNGSLVAYQKLPGGSDNADVDLAFGYSITDIPLSTSDVVAQLSRVYPNPSTGLMTVTGVNITSLELFNLLGQKVLESNIKTINADKLSRGNYFLKINTDKGSAVKKILLG